MIARALYPAVALALPLLASAQAPRAHWSVDERGADAPVVRVWIPGSWSLRFGQQVPVSFDVSEPAHVAVFRVDGDGRLTVLWPLRHSLQTAARAGQEYRITGPHSSYAAFAADYGLGQGMVIAIASPDPIDLTAFRRYRNDPALYHYVNDAQRRYVGGVKHIVDRITQEILYAVDSPYDYDVAFYSVTGNGRYYASSYCDATFAYMYPGSRYYRAYSTWGSALGDWDDCYGRRYYGYYAYCSAWRSFYGAFDSNWCRLGNPFFWPTTPGPVAGGPQPQPRPNTDMIDTIMSRPVDSYPLIDRKGESTTNGTTHVVVMQPVREPPNGTRWLPDDETDAISLPARFRREPGDPARSGRGGRISTRDEGYTRSPSGGLRVSDPSMGDQPPERTPGSAFMPPVREAPRPTVWRDNGRDQSSPAPQRWERPRVSEPRSPSRDSDSRIDRSSTPSGGSSTTPSTGASTATPRTDASVTKTDSKASDSKTTGQRKPE